MSASSGRKESRRTSERWRTLKTGWVVFTCVDVPVSNLLSTAKVRRGVRVRTDRSNLVRGLNAVLTCQTPTLERELDPVLQLSRRRLHAQACQLEHRVESVCKLTYRLLTCRSVRLTVSGQSTMVPQYLSSYLTRIQFPNPPSIQPQSLKMRNVSQPEHPHDCRILYGTERYKDTLPCSNNVSVSALPFRRTGCSVPLARACKTRALVSTSPTGVER